ncbi:hypothetical protein HNQ77_000988 [Silvibacterium bohemicum]|uniref:Uncharacterized protein n=1 Tax=Silvibacterium bohemicum TaxID=1577686 RepID=A0A841JYJ9_9BACT|nr:hypothetical protein [Silvibacterium bohemicum]
MTSSQPGPEKMPDELDTEFAAVWKQYSNCSIRGQSARDDEAPGAPSPQEFAKIVEMESDVRRFFLRALVGVEPDFVLALLEASLQVTERFSRARPESKQAYTSFASAVFWKGLKTCRRQDALRQASHSYRPQRERRFLSCKFIKLLRYH